MSSEDIKPTVTLDGHEVFNIPVEEEELELADSMGQSKMWAMKVPRFLLERWERVKQGGVHLGTLVVDHNETPPKITLKLPVEKEEKEANGKAKDKKGKDKDKDSKKRPLLDVHGIPNEYEVSLPSHVVKNTYVFTEHERTWVAQPGEEGSAARRKRQKAHPRLLGPLDHEGSVRPITSDSYLKILERRRLDYEQSKRPIVQLDDTKMSQAKLNQLASGFANATSNIGRGMVLGQTRVAPGERFARLERHELTDRLFQLFSDKPYWSISAIKQTLQQPDAWLREVLKDVAAPIKEGQYANMWELKENWKEGAGAKAEPKDEDDEDVDVDVDDLEAGPDEEMSDDEDEFEEV